MNLSVNKKFLSGSADQFLRRAGYGFIRDGRSGQESYVRRLGQNHYPRLHMYYDNQGENIILKLHIDQTQSRFGGGHDHNTEYDSQVVAAEIERLKSVLRASVEDGQRAEVAKEKTVERKSWWRRMFGF